MNCTIHDIIRFTIRNLNSPIHDTIHDTIHDSTNMVRTLWR